MCIGNTAKAGRSEPRSVLLILTVNRVRENNHRFAIGVAIGRPCASHHRHHAPIVLSGAAPSALHAQRVETLFRSRGTKSRKVCRRRDFGFGLYADCVLCSVSPTHTFILQGPTEMSDPFLAQVTMFAGNFAPRGWAYCNGSLLAISQYSAVFSLLGTTYGGDGRTTFALPDLRGRSPRGHCGGAGPGLANVPLGSRGGAVNHTLTIQQMPAHSHNLKNNAIDDDGNLSEAAGNALAESANSYRAGTPNGRTLPDDTQSVGNNQAFDILNPYLGLNYIIALVGTFPSRN